MYPLRMTRSLAVAAGLLALALPASASAAELKVSPQKRCYSAGESVNLLGSGFTPAIAPTPGDPDPDEVRIDRGAAALGTLDTDAAGAFNGVLTLAQDSGRRTKTYTATDLVTPGLSASLQITVSAVRVKLSPETGPPGRVMKLRASGFTTGKTLWAHVRRGKSKRNFKLGRLKGACGGLVVRRRLLPRNAPLGVHTVQFDTFRKYKANRAVSDRYTITVS
jgi:hypothetical protein